MYEEVKVKPLRNAAGTLQWFIILKNKFHEIYDYDISIYYNIIEI